MAATINKPGGAILEMEDGSRESFAYGQEVPSNISDAQKAHLSNVADGAPRQSADAGVLKAAHERAANAAAGPLSSSSPVPGNYHELDESAACNLIRVLEQWPMAQARLVIHERMNEGRQAVLEAATTDARDLAQTLIEQEGLALDVPTDVHESVGTPAPEETGDGEGGEEETPAEDPKPKTTRKRKADEETGDTPPPTS